MNLLCNLINPRWLVGLFTCYSGGGSGGGGSSGVKYDNLENLYGVQSRAAGFMLDQAMPNISNALSNSGNMVNEAMDGTLATRARNTAGADAEQAFGNNLAAVNRNTAKFGAEFNPNRMAEMGNSAAVGGSLAKATAMNKASQWAEDQKWNRNAGLYAQASGTGSGAMQGMSSAGSGLSGIANMQNQTDMANAQGYGQFGASLSYGLMKKDGGYIAKPKKGFGARLAGGGDAWAAYKAANPITVSGNANRRGSTSPGLAIAYGAAPMMLGAGLKDVMNLDGKGGKLVAKGKELYAKLTAPGQQQQQISMADAPEHAGAQLDMPDMSGFDSAAAAGDMGYDVSSSYDAGNVAMEGAAPAADVASGADYVDGASSFSDASSLWAADGGMIHKKAKGHGLRLAQGGGLFKAMPSVASMDASSSLAMPRLTTMDDKPKQLPKVAQQAAVGTTDVGKTDGMGETSNSDPDGFGKESPDNRHLAGKATMMGIGRWLGGGAGGAAGSALAEVVHPIAEPLTRTMIRTGDKAGGVGGAILLDPIGSSASGKYSSEDILRGNAEIAAGVPWLDKFLADGGESGEPDQRVDFKPGGDVQGPGTETSDSIPAWLSDGEIVHNADAVKLAGKDALLEINNAGRDVREGKATPKEAQQKIGQVMMQRGKQLAGKSVKLADGGDAERLMREMEAKYGVSGKSAPQEQPQQQAQQKVAEQQKPQTMADRLRSFATGNLDGRMKAIGLKRGGCVAKLADGGSAQDNDQKKGKDNLSAFDRYMGGLRSAAGIYPGATSESIEVRQDKRPSPDMGNGPNSIYQKQGIKLAGGGMLGISLGAGVNQWNKQQQLDQQQQMLDVKKREDERAGQEFEWKTADRAKQDALGKSLEDIANQEAAGDTSGYIAQKEDEAKKAFDALKAEGIVTGEYQPTTPEQRNVLARTAGLGKMSPYLQYDLDMQRSRAYTTAGDAKMADALRERATQTAAGNMIGSLMSGDYATAGKLYNTYPNGHTIDRMEKGDNEDSITVYDKGEKKSIPKYDLVMASLAHMNPQAAANMLAKDQQLKTYLDKSNAQIASREKIEREREDARERLELLRQQGKKGAGDSANSLMDDPEQFIKNMKYGNDDGDIARKASTWYTQLASSAGPEKLASKDYHQNLRFVADSLARGDLHPNIQLNPATLQWESAVTDKTGINKYPLRQGAVDPLQKNTATDVPFNTPESVAAAEKDVVLRGIKSGSLGGQSIDAIKKVIGNADALSQVEQTAAGNTLVDGKWVPVINVAKTPEQINAARQDMAKASQALRAIRLYKAYATSQNNGSAAAKPMPYRRTEDPDRKLDPYNIGVLQNMEPSYNNK